MFLVDILPQSVVLYYKAIHTISYKSKFKISFSVVKRVYIENIFSLTVQTLWRDQ